jgi:hypothetical protein
LRGIIALTLSVSFIVALFHAPPDSDTNVVQKLLVTLLPVVIGFVVGAGGTASVARTDRPRSQEGPTILFDGIAVVRGLLALGFTLVLPFVMYYAHDSNLVDVYTTAVDGLVGYYFAKRTAENAKAAASNA